MKIYFDQYGNFKKHEKAYFQATSFGVDTVDIYADFDITNYIPNITFRRADGFVIGPLKMNPITGGYSRLIDFESILAVKGSLEISIRFEKYIYDSLLQEDIILESKVCAMDVAYVYDNIPQSKDVLNEILKKIDKDELLDGESAYEIAVRNGFIGTEQDWLESLKEGIIHHGETEPELRKGIWLDENVEGVGNDDVIVVRGAELQVIGNVSGQIPVLQDLIVKGAEISLVEGNSGQIQISGGEITIVNGEGVEETLIDETLTVSSVDMVGGTKYITIDNVIPII